MSRLPRALFLAIPTVFASLGAVAEAIADLKP
jgi:hypothetical protein